MRLLHTSDWHLGRSLHGKRRYEEFARFLDWLLQTLIDESIDVLIVAGDVFDTGTPSNRAQTLYYDFLTRVAVAGVCRHVVVVAGNHDSPTFLDAPRELLRNFNIHVVGTAADDPAREVLLLDCTPAAGGAPEQLIVCAVPYLRDRDIRQVEPGEQIEDKERKLLEGIATHYAKVAEAALLLQSRQDVPTPIVATGHLFTAGGQVSEGDGVRELYVGSLARLRGDRFPEAFDYLALGHLHVPQVVGGNPLRRYAGSPLAMGFGEVGQRKSVCVVDLGPEPTRVRLREVPVFQRLERVTGDWSAIEARLAVLAAEGAAAWIEINHDAETIVGDLRERVQAAVTGTALEVLRIRNNRVFARVLEAQADETSLDDLAPEVVFERRLAAAGVPEEERPALRVTYAEVLRSLAEDDIRAE